MHFPTAIYKVLLCLPGCLIMRGIDTRAQEHPDATQKVAEVIQSVENVSAVRNMVAIRKALEEDVNKVKYLSEQKKVQESQVEPLRRQYGDVQANYNYIFDELKRDLMATRNKTNYTRIHSKYDSRTVGLQTDYEAFHRSVAALESSGNRSVFVPIIIGAVELLIDVIRAKKLERVHMLDAFNNISPYFSQKFYMRDWEELWPEYAGAAGISSRMQASGKNYGQNMFSAPYALGQASADIELYLGDPASAALVKQTMIPGLRIGNIQKLSSAKSYHPGDKFAIQVRSGQFIYFFALDNETQRLQLLYPERTRNTTISNDGGHAGYATYDSVVRLPSSGTYMIDNRGASEKWIVLVSQSELFNADAFAQKYVRITPGTRNTTISTGKDFDSKKIRDENSNTSYSPADIMKVYEINILKAL